MNRGNGKANRQRKAILSSGSNPGSSARNDNRQRGPANLGPRPASSQGSRVRQNHGALGFWSASPTASWPCLKTERSSASIASRSARLRLRVRWVNSRSSAASRTRCTTTKVRSSPPARQPSGTRWMGLSAKGYGIHGTNQPNSIGKAASTGCIRMGKQDVEELFAIVDAGDTVQIRLERDEQIATVFGSGVGTGAESQTIAQVETGLSSGGGQ